MLLKMRELETERMRLREFRPTDLTDVSSWEGIAQAEKFLQFCSQSYREWGMGPWAMLLKESETIVGNCGFWHISYERDGGALEYLGEVNYYVAPQHRGQGLATEALTAVLKFGFDDIQLTRIQARCSAENLSSERVMLKTGLQFERMIGDAPQGLPEQTALERHLPEQNPTQQKLYVISREDFLQRASSNPSNSSQTGI